MLKRICSFSLFAAALLCGSYFIPAGGHDGPATTLSRLRASGQDDFLPLDKAGAAAQQTGKKHLISQYDELMKQEADREGYDWRLLSAIAYQESRFDNTVVSRRGAAGIMQVMPATARQFKVPQEQMTNPRINIRLAAKLLRQIERSLRFPTSTPHADRTKIVLACYNGGIGHVLDARRLAGKYGANPNCWEDVSAYLTLKGNSETADDEAVECGQFKGSRETLAFVNGVMNRYTNYCEKAGL